MSTKRDAVIGRAFGIAAGISYGISWVLTRQGVGDLTTPLVGASIALLSGTLGLMVIGGRGVKAGMIENRKGIVILLISGLVAACGVIASFFALSIAPVVIVGPLQSTHPLFALVWSWLFLGQLEKITPRLVLGSILVVGGVVLINIGRATLN